MRSNIKEVIYLNWLIPVDIAYQYVPQNIKLIEKDGKTPYTILTYKHGDFGPVFLGFFRKFCFSPFQSNWRFYIEAIDSKKVPSGSVFFYKNFIGNTIYSWVINTFSKVLNTIKPKAISIVESKIMIESDLFFRAELIENDDSIYFKDFLNYYGTSSNLFEKLIEQQNAYSINCGRIGEGRLRLDYKDLQIFGTSKIESNNLGSILNNLPCFAFKLMNVKLDIMSDKWWGTNFRKVGRRYELKFETYLNSDINTVWDFFSRPKNLEKVSPDSSKVVVELNESQEVYVNMIFDVKMKLFGLISQCITSKVCNVNKPFCFDDSQEKGAFKFWKHQHFFEEEDEGVIVKDIITFELPYGILGDFFFHIYLKKELMKTFQYREKALRKYCFSFKITNYTMS